MALPVFSNVTSQPYTKARLISMTAREKSMRTHFTG
jgi:hypothetical protein